MRNLWTRRLPLIVCLAGAALFAQTGVAFATQYFVDGETGDDTNTCLQPLDGASLLGPCATIDQGLDLAQANPGPDEVLVAQFTYAETLVVSDGTLLRALDATEKPLINNSPTADDAVSITGSGGSVDGFEIRSGFRPLSVAALSVAGAGSVTNNDFPTTAAPSTNQDITVFASATGSVLIAGNSFTDDSIGTQLGVQSAATSATNLTIQDNDFSGLNTAIFQITGNGSPLIADNDIAGVHDSGYGVLVYEGSPTIRHNTIDAPGAGTSQGVNVQDTNGPVDAALSRNTITGHSFGIVVIDTSVPATLNGDLITGSTVDGIQASNLGSGGDVNATNVTVHGSGDDDIQLQDNNLNLDSSIVGNTISTTGTAVCASIEFSRGPTLVGPITGCGSFDTLADPMFATPGTNYHLMAGSPMIDAGNTLAPPAGSLDIDGDPRALSGTPGCTLMAGPRDIGADEFVPATGIGCPPPAITPTPTLAPVPQKKCKKGQRLKRGRCVKKKRKKR